MVYRNKRKGQAAIEFLMTYGWMLLVVLIVGALIFSFVDFGSLLPNRLDLSNNLRGDPTGSIAYAGDFGTAADRNDVVLVFRYNGAKRVTINGSAGDLSNDLGESCPSDSVTNLDTGSTVTGANPVPFLNGQDGLIRFDDCLSNGFSSALLDGDTLIGDVSISVEDPKTGLAIPSTGSLRLQITG